MFMVLYFHCKKSELLFHEFCYIDVIGAQLQIPLPQLSLFVDTKRGKQATVVVDQATYHSTFYYIFYNFYFSLQFINLFARVFQDIYFIKISLLLCTNSFLRVHFFLCDFLRTLLFRGGTTFLPPPPKPLECSRPTQP